MIEYAGPLTALAGLVAFVIAAAVLCHWLLEPVNRAAGHLNAPTRFQLTDFIWLMMQLQVLLAIVMQTIAEALPQRALWIILGGLTLPVLVLWAASVSVVSRAGITQPMRRAAVILLLVPGSLAEVMAVPLLIVGGVAFVNNEPPGLWHSVSGGSVPQRLLVLALIAVSVAVAAVALRWLSFWVLTGGPSRAATMRAQ
jgi:hypothetical protein